MSALRTALRELLTDLFTVPSAFEAFFSDRFPSVQRLTATGMNRTQQITLLLERLAPHQVLGALMIHFSSQPEILALIEQKCAGTAAAESEINQQILTLSFEIALRRAKNVPTDAMSRRLVDLKKRRRELREGPSLSPGHVLGGRYKLETMIGKGGFATVWLAFDYQTATLVAIKVLHTEQASSKHQIERFERGARTIRSLNHPYIVRLLAEPQVEEGYHYTVLEYAPHGDLDSAVTKQGLSDGAGLRCVLQVSQALAFAHQHNLIHRDVKPQNILVAADDSARLTDFDLVHDDDTTGGTRTGALGTFLYAAPEQREDASRVDMRADIYGIGLTAIFVIYGKRLPQTIIQNIDRESFISNLRCPRSIKEVLRQATKAAPDDRYKSMGDFVAALERAMGPSIIAMQKPNSASKDSAEASQKSNSETAHRSQYSKIILVSIISVSLFLFGAAKILPWAKQDGSNSALRDAGTKPGYDASQPLGETGGVQTTSSPSGAKVSLGGRPLDQAASNVPEQTQNKTPTRKNKPSRIIRRDDLDSLLDSASSGSGGKPKGKDKEALPEQLSMTDIQTILNGVSVASCTAQGASGVVNVRLIISPDGSVSSATPSDSSALGHDCVAKKAKGAKFGRFFGDPMTFTFPFIVRPPPKDDLDSLLDSASSGSGGKPKSKDK